MNRTPRVGYPNSTNLFEVGAVLWQRVTHQYGYIGVGLSLGLTRYLATLLYGVNTRDAWTFCSVAFLLIAVALLASYIPARRATRVDPVNALRCE